jgi:filamentous hemagglutinin
VTSLAFSTIPSGAAVANAVNNPLSVLGGNLGPMSKSAFEGAGKNIIPSNAAKQIVNADRTGTALRKSDPAHRAASYLSEKQLAAGKTFNITGGDGVQRTLLQTPGSLNGKSGAYEYMLEPNGMVSHQRFIEKGIITGKPNQVVKP